MTGEITLGEFVMPVGGIKEKTMAARRSGVTTLVFPAGNRKDVEVWSGCVCVCVFVCFDACCAQELPAHLVEGLTIHFAETYDDVYRVAFEPISAPESTSSLS